MNKTEAFKLKQIASRLFCEHYEGCNRNDPDNCGSCALYLGDESGPNYAGWARVYVEAEKPIKEEWRNAFYKELTSDNTSYRKALEDSVRWFGVRWN